MDALRTFRNLPVKHKITAITLLTILVVSLISSTVFVTIESRGARRAMVEQLKTITGILADNSTAALVFDDPASAEETLSALRAEPNIVWARVDRTNGSSSPSMRRRTRPTTRATPRRIRGSPGAPGPAARTNSFRSATRVSSSPTRTAPTSWAA